MLGLILVCVLLALILGFIVRFALADGDFTVLSKGRAKRKDVEGKVVWITGASRGLGEELAKQFAELGAKLILSARNKAGLERVKSEIVAKYANVEVEVLPLDLTAAEDTLKEAVKKAEFFFSGSGVYYMVHNAGDDPDPISALEITEESLKKTLMTNVLGTINLTRFVAPSMLERGGGHFVVMSSAAGKCPAPGQSGYSASKFALNGYFHTLRSELYQKGIKVTVLCPGQIDCKPITYGSNSAETPMPLERGVQLMMSAITHGLKEVWIANQPLLLVMYLMQYLPTVGFWFMDLIGANRVSTSALEGNVSFMTLVFGNKKEESSKSAPLLK